MAAQVHKTEQAWRGGAFLSLLLHAGLAALFVYGAYIAHWIPLGGAHPGTAAPGAIEANLVDRVPGGAIPMPSPVAQITPNRLASDDPNIGRRPPHLVSTAPAKSVPLPSYQPEQTAQQQAQADLRKLIQSETKHPLSDPYGGAGAASFKYSTSQQGNSGSSGIQFGDASFGTQYPNWENGLRDALQNVWNQQPKSPNLPTGQTVTVVFTVHTDGSIDSNIRYNARTSSLELNDMAMRTVRQVAASNKFPLPAGYSHGTLEVSVGFNLK